MRGRWLALLLLSIGLVACASRLPGWARPQGEIVHSGRVDRTDSVAYRTLTREDFRAAAPPAGRVAQPEKLGALTCSYLVPAPGARFEVIQVPGPNPVFRARIIGLGFEALMDRKCSWWNDAQTQFPAAYVLQHEQIHFGLFELAARRFNARAPQIEQQSVVEAGSQQDAMSAVQARVERELEGVMDEVLDRSLRFDEDTSNGYRPDRQKVWFETVMRELAETASLR